MIGKGWKADGSEDEACNALETDFLSVLEEISSGSCTCSNKPSDECDTLQKHCSVQQDSGLQ